MPAGSEPRQREPRSGDQPPVTLVDQGEKIVTDLLLAGAPEGSTDPVWTILEVIEVLRG